MFIVISGSTQVPLKGYDDRRQMMVLLEIVRNHNCCTKENREVTSQIWFSRILRRFHSEKKKQQHTDLSLWHKGLCILDVFAAHRSNEFLNVMAIKNTSCVRQHKLQPFKNNSKKIFEKNIKNEFQQYYVHEIEKSLGDTGLENVKNKLKTSCYQRKACTVAYTCYTKKTFNTKRSKKSY